MRIYTRLSILFLLLAFSVHILHAEDDKLAYQMVAWFNEGFDIEKLAVPFSENPQIKVEGKMIRLISENEEYGELYFTHDNLNKFTLEVIPVVPTAVDTKEHVDTFTLRSNKLSIYGRPNMLVCVYDEVGKLIQGHRTNENGYIEINILSLQRGSYIVQCGKSSFKFIR